MQYPIIQAPMAEVTTPEFVATAAEVGILWLDTHQDSLYKEELENLFER